MIAAGVPFKVAARRRSVTTALFLAGIGTLTRVRAAVPLEVVALRCSVATALHLAGIGALARAREFTICAFLTNSFMIVNYYG